MFCKRTKQKKASCLEWKKREIMNQYQKNDLIEEFMPRAAQLALEMADGSVPLEDLTQEANLGLVMGVNRLAEAEEEDAIMFLPVTETIEAAIRAQIEEAQAEAAALNARDKALIGQVQAMSAEIQRLTAELGAKPTVDELANALKIPQSKVIETLKLMGEDLPDERPDDPWETNPDLQRFLPK